MARRRRLSDEGAAVLQLFLEDPTRERFGLEIIRLTGIKSGSLYPILHRFEERELISARWEDVEVAAEQRRRPRRCYRFDLKQLRDAEELYRQWAEARPAQTARGASALRPAGNAA